MAIVAEDHLAGRPITAQEIAVIRATLEQAALDAQFRAAEVNLDTLKVVDRCSCGCDSVDFEKNGQDSLSRPVADGIGMTAAGGQIGVIVWGRVKRDHRTRSLRPGCR